MHIKTSRNSNRVPSYIRPVQDSNSLLVNIYELSLYAWLYAPYHVTVDRFEVALEKHICTYAYKRGRKCESLMVLMLRGPLYYSWHRVVVASTDRLEYVFTQIRHLKHSRLLIVLTP